VYNQVQPQQWEVQPLQYYADSFGNYYDQNGYYQPTADAGTKSNYGEYEYCYDYDYNYLVEQLPFEVAITSSKNVNPVSQEFTNDTDNPDETSTPERETSIERVRVTG
jgi:hypothetical protein